MRGQTNHIRLLLGVLFLLVLAGQLSAGESRDDLWKQVDTAIENRLPRTAQAVLDQIIPGALEDQAYAEATRAICLKISLEGQIQGGDTAGQIALLETEIANAPEPMKPVMETILAHWYWQYFQQNSWRFIQRTQTAEPPGADITTWDLPRILAEIDRHFTLALEAEQELKTIPINEWDDLLEKGTVPDSYRPTLYDFLAFEALSFYSAGEQAGTIPQDAFEFMADSPIFGTVTEFLAWQPETSDTDSAKLKAIGLYQDLLSFHQDDSDKSAFIDADLQRLMFGNNYALGPDKASLYIAALERFVAEWADNEIAARALYEWAQAVYSQRDYVRAHELASRGWSEYPDSFGGTWCYNLIQQIEAKSASIRTERVWNEPMPDIQVTYRNVTRIFFKAVPLPAEDAIQSTWRYLNDDELKILLGMQPALEWNEDLPVTNDYQERTETLPAPEGLEKGFYFIIANYDPSFNQSDNRISYARIWVSDMALVIRNLNRVGLIEGFVLYANSGEPIAGAKVTRWRYSSSTCWKDGQTSTDENGLFSFSYDGDWTYYYLFLVEYQGQKLATENSYRIYTPQDDPEPDERTIFFTDRSLYRPGQTVHYKGICIHTDTITDNYQTLAGRSLTVIFRDTNYQEISRQEQKCNDYGSFSGSFTVPRDRLMGRMSITVLNNTPSGSTYFNVEEYKRPKFRIQLDAPAEAPRLDTEVIVPGNATAYTGAAIGGAEVEWRVVRRVRFPIWCWWARWIYPSATEQAIAHGSTVTETNGSFSINFTAKPDLSILEEDEPVFEYLIHADVTDTTGETRSDDYIVRAGYTALVATIEADAWQTQDKPVEMTITTQSIDGQPESADGTVQIYALEQPAKVIRASLISTGQQPDPSNPDMWETADLVSEQTFKTGAQGRVVLSAALDTGIYRALLQTQDRFGKSVTAQHTIQVVDTQAEHFDEHVANFFAAPTWSVEPGETFMALWGTGYDTGRAYVELECRGELLSAWWTDPNRTQEVIEQDVTEDMRGGFTIRVTYVRENRAYINERIVDVPWTNKQLTIQWEHFRSLLEPGQNETWTAVISGPDARGAVAEMVASMYDVSLDQYLQHYWQQSFSGFRAESARLSSRFENSSLLFNTVFTDWSADYIYLNFLYRHFPYDIVYPYYGGIGASAGGVAPPMGRGGDETTASYSGGGQEPAAQEPAPDLSQVSARENLNETAFFFPHLISNTEGEVRIEFTIPEALTEWKFMGFAHDNQLRSGFLTDTTVTAKDLMVEPNPPRFVREGDIIEFTVKVTNQSAARQTGRVSLTLADARTLESRDEALGNLSPEQDFDVPSMESRTYSWRLTIPDDCDFLTYRAVGATTRLSDGEEAYLPVLSRRILVTESLPLPIRGPQTKKFEFTKLLNSGQSETLSHQSLTVQMVSQPAWYAVMALPYLMEYPYECSEQIFNRFYANTLASYIANSDPKIRQVFDQWKATPALDSPLEKNEDLKSVALEETPWIRQAIRESEARRNVGILFDQNRLNDETSRALFKLQQMQYGDGLWPWFPGCTGNEYITLYITTGFGRLRHLGVNQIDVSCAIKALGALDNWMDQRYHWILEYDDKDVNHLTSTVAFYLYGRSFFLADKPVASQYQEALEYWLRQARQYWTTLWRQSQAHLAIALKRFGDLQTPGQIMQSIREYSVTDDELGMYWRDTEHSWWWYRAPIETQALMIEAFDEVSGDAQAVEDCKVWLLKQKQTQDWKTTKATADAIYGLLLRGTDLLSSNALVEVALGGQWIQPEQVEAGTGFYEERFVRGEIEPDMGHITVKKVDEGVSWGSVHWQYLEDMSKVTPYEGTPLQLKKTLFVKRTTNEGQVLFPIDDSLAVGDELVVRIELRVDRDMEYVHLKDQRPSGSEPVDVLSRYHYQDGLGYYQSTRDTATHFFMDYLPKGVYVFEYSTRIQNKGKYQTGIASIQCMYAPEFNSHSESFELEVR